MKALVTGGAGFIGSHIVEGYLAEGLEVVVVDNLVRGSRTNLPKDVRLHVCDVRDRAALATIFEHEQPEIVSHHAAQTDIRSSIWDPISDVQTNLIGSINLLNLSVKYKIRRFILASTGVGIYGDPTTLPAGEDTPARPLSPYGINKRSVELYLENYRIRFGLPYIVLRYGNVYGPRQNAEGEAGVIAVFCRNLLMGVPPTIFGDGTKTRDYIEVSDVVRANLKALEYGERSTFNIASGKPTTDYQIFKTVREALGMPFVEPRYVPMRPGEVAQICLDISRAEKELTWTPKVELAVGIKRSAAWFERHPAHSAAIPLPARLSLADGERRAVSRR